MDTIKPLISIRFLPVLLAILLAFSASAQEEKREVEKSIGKSQMPKEALELLEPLLKNTRNPKFYYETNGKESSYEAKFRWKGRMLSIEFFEDGRLMDIEELISFKEIDEPQQAIHHYFKETFDKYKMLRVQRQYSAEERKEKDKEVIKEFMENDRKDLTIRYEIVSQVQNKELFDSYEFLFDDEGKLINKQKIDRRSVDNILY